MEQERLTWNQIQRKYPDQWVGLVDVKYVKDDGIFVESAIVKYTDLKKSELTHKALNGEIVSIVNDKLFLSFTKDIPHRMICYNSVCWRRRYETVFASFRYNAAKACNIIKKFFDCSPEESSTA